MKPRAGAKRRAREVPGARGAAWDDPIETIHDVIRVLCFADVITAGMQDEMWKVTITYVRQRESGCWAWRINLESGPEEAA